MRFEVIAATDKKMDVLGDVPPCSLVAVDVSEKLNASVIRVKTKTASFYETFLPTYKSTRRYHPEEHRESKSTVIAVLPNIPFRMKPFLI
jgi:hypothetical protein